MRSDGRAVSTAVHYIMTLMVVSLLTSGLFVVTGDVVNSQRDQALRGGMEVVGNRVAADIAATDRLAATAGDNGDVVMKTRLPDDIAGETYQIRIEDTGSMGSYEIKVTNGGGGVSVTVPVRTQIPVETGIVHGGDIVIRYDTDTLVVEHA